jgi:deoxycytidylate deaminase
MAALIVAGGRVIAQSCNGKQCGQHAEILALSKTTNTSGSTIYIARSSKRISKPCRHCFRLIKQFKVEKVVFIDEYGKLVKKKVRYENDNSYKSQNYRYVAAPPSWASSYA